MTLATNTAIDIFSSDGHDPLHGTGTIGLIASTGWSAIATTGIRQWVNTEDAKEGLVTLIGALASNGTAGTYIDLYARPMDVLGAGENDNEPSDNYKKDYVGSFLMEVGTTAQQITIDIPLKNWKTSSKYDFYINNKTGLQLDAGWVLWIAPKGTGPVA